MNVTKCVYNECPNNCNTDQFWHIENFNCMPNDLRFDKPFDYYIIFLSFLIGIIGAVTGIGGGTIAIPIFFLTTSLPSEIIVPIVSMGIFGASLTQYFINCRFGRIEKPEQPLINYTFLLAQAPMFSFFAYFGALLNQYASKMIILNKL